MEVQTTDLRLEGSRVWRNGCTHPVDDRKWRYLPVFDFVTGQMVCDRCGEVIAGSVPTL
jgi:hypothetical protein